MGLVQHFYAGHLGALCRQQPYEAQWTWLVHRPASLRLDGASLIRLLRVLAEIGKGEEEPLSKLEDFQAGLRCHDLHTGLSNLDPNSATVAPLSDTRIVGMAASLGALIRGQDVIADAEALKSIIAEELDIAPYAFNAVVELLERVGFVSVQRKGKKITGFTENVPFHERLYDQLGEAWRGDEPSQLEQEMIALIDRLARSPVPAEELEDDLGLDRADIPRLLQVGKATQLAKGVTIIDGEVLYSPFFGFENPEILAELLERHGSGRIAEELEAVRKHQGLPLDEGAYPALADAISRG